MKRERQPFKAKINIDLSEWDLGPWPERIQEAIKVDIVGNTITIEITTEAFENAAREIAQEAVQCFFEDGIYFVVTQAGIVIADDGDSAEPVTVPWDDVMLTIDGYPDTTTAAAAAVREWVTEEEKRIKEDNE